MATARARMLPTILIIGAQKCGTTSLYHLLVEHPDVGAAAQKEIHYFDNASQRSELYYRSFFPVRGRFRHTLESSPYYLFHPAVPERVHRMLPDVRLLVLLRDPVSRSYSHYNHFYGAGWESLGFAEAIDAEESRLKGEHDRLLRDPAARSIAHQNHSYVSRSIYTPQIKRWYEYFPRDHVLIIQAEDLFSDPAGTVTRVQDWLGLATHLPANLQPRNARHYDALELGIADRLQARFAADRIELEALTGQTFNWS